MADNDPQQELKKRARRRLVGALALALAAAIVLPMVMDGEPKPPASELQIRIPSQEGSNFTSRAIKSVAVEPAASVSPPSVSSAPLSAQSRPVTPVANSSEAASNKDALVTASKSESAAQSVPESHKPKQAGPSADVSAGKKEEAKAREDARAQAILEGHPVTAPAHTDKADVFYVQLGVYRDADNAKEVQSKAASHGVKSVLQKAGVNTRVRSGPFADRAAADAVVSKLKQAGLSGFVAIK